MSEPTKGPFCWRRVAGGWMLGTIHGGFKVVLMADRWRTEGPTMLSRGDDGRMVEFNPRHPDALLIEASWDLRAACEADAAYLDHRDRCNDCADAVYGNGRDAHCEAGRMLRERADTLRTAALLKAKGETP